MPEKAEVIRRALLGFSLALIKAVKSASSGALSMRIG